MTETTRLSEPVDPPQEGEDFLEWLSKQISDEPRWLLAHADDGVIWGRWNNDKIITSHDVAPHISPELRLITLQQAFIFGEQDEIRLWREGQGWRARRISAAHDAEFLDEAHVLWGDEVVEFPDGADGKGFTHVRETRQGGMDHIVPLVVTRQELRDRKLKLRVRHIITHDQTTGEARIALSRLVRVEISQEDEQ